MIRGVTAGSIQIRRGASDDLPQIREFTHNTFSWGDYLPRAWNDWARSKRGALLVAEINHKIVGTIHVRYLEHREAWLEGVRVHQEYRQRGIASALIQTAHADAKKKKCRVIRLETGAHNVAAQHAFKKLGYRRRAAYVVFKGAACAEETNQVRLAQARDLQVCWALWQQSWVRRASKTIVPAVYGWRWWELTRTRLANDIRGKRVWVAPRGFMILREMDRDFDVTLLVGTKRDAVKLLQAGRMLAQQRGREDIYWLAPAVAHSKEWADAAEYTLDDDGLLVYAREL